MGMAVIGSTAAGAAEVAAAPASCPGYVSHLRDARISLAHGDRSGALAELRKAKEALGSCLRAQEERRGVARATRPSHDLV